MDNALNFSAENLSAWTTLSILAQKSPAAERSAAGSFSPYAPNKTG